MDDETEADRPREHQHRLEPRLHQRDEQDDRPVEEPPLDLGMIVLRLEELERAVDHDRADEDADDLPKPPRMTIA